MIPTKNCSTKRIPSRIFQVFTKTNAEYLQFVGELIDAFAVVKRFCNTAA
jgi:hypothetical protein